MLPLMIARCCEDHHVLFQAQIAQSPRATNDRTYQRKVILCVIKIQRQQYFLKSEPFQYVYDCHELRSKRPVLGESSGFIGADGGGGAKRLDGLQVLYQTIFRRHSLGCQGETDRDGCQQT